jgi:hypothetical protein
VIAVADGLGSASKSEVGAQLAVNAAVETALCLLADPALAEKLPADIVLAGVKGARRALEDKAAKDECSLRDLACTIIVVVVHGVELAVAHIGDGAVVAQTESGLQLVSGPGESEYTNEVVPLTSVEWEQSLRTVHIEGSISRLAVFTDGCQRAAFRKTAGSIEPFEGFFRPIFEYLEECPDNAEAEQELQALLASKKLCENSEDDKTLVVAVINQQWGKP